MQTSRTSLPRPSVPSAPLPVARRAEQVGRPAATAPGTPVFVDVTARRLRRLRRAALGLIAACLAYVAMLGATLLTDPVEPHTSPAAPEGMPPAAVSSSDGAVPPGLVDSGDLGIPAGSR